LAAQQGVGAAAAALPRVAQQGVGAAEVPSTVEQDVEQGSSPAWRRPSPIDPFVPGIRDALLESLYASGSDLLTLPMQDLFGWTDRINVPALIADTNWTWKLPWLVDELDDQPEARERQATLKMWAVRHGRLS
jgi:4-alpha-glucanotransferase